MANTNFTPSTQILEAAERAQSFADAGETLKPFFSPEIQETVDGVDKIANALNATGHALKHFGFDEAEPELDHADPVTGDTVGNLANADEDVGGMYNRVTGIGGTITTESWYNGQRVSDELANISGQLNDQADSITGETTTAMNVGGNVSWMDPTPAEPNYMQESKVWSGYCGTIETLNDFGESIVPQSQSFSIASHLVSTFRNNQFGDHPDVFPKVELPLA